MAKYMNRSPFLEPKYMNGVDFEMSGRTFVPKWYPLSPPRESTKEQTKRSLTFFV